MRVRSLLHWVSFEIRSRAIVYHLEVFTDGHSEEVPSTGKYVSVNMPLTISTGDFEVREIPILKHGMAFCARKTSHGVISFKQVNRGRAEKSSGKD